MKRLIKPSIFFLAMMMLAAVGQAQQPTLQYFRANDKSGLNVFETPKQNDIPFEGVKVRLGGSFAATLQGLQQSNNLAVGDTLTTLASNFTLPTANLTLDAQLADGLRMHLGVYLSSRHHSEAWVKGGYLQVDNLNFIHEGLLAGLMNVATVRVGMDEINYGDTHFRRTDNARAIFNPFVGNYIMDSFTTEPFAEVTVQNKGVLVVAGATNGRLNQVPTPGDNGMAVYGKLGYDNTLGDNLRVRLTTSLYHSTEGGTRDYLYNGDRAGARYYKVLEGNVSGGSDFLPRLNTGFAYQTALMVNPFVKFKGLEFFGVYERANNGNAQVGGGYTQLGTEALYRMGTEEQFYIGGRYNRVNGQQTAAASIQSIQRINLGGGWFVTDNILAKVEYVAQQYSGDGYQGTKFQEAQFNGVVVEATIGF